MTADGRLSRSLRSLRALRPQGRRAGARRPPRRRLVGARGARRRRLTVPSAAIHWFRALKSPSRRALAAAVIAACVAVLIGGWLWLRDSSLVSVRRVTVTGVSGPNANQIRAALTAVTRGMTTLDVSEGRLRAAVSPYSIVKGLQVSTHFPHAVTIEVIEQVPVAAVMVGKRQVPVAADGTVLRDVPARGALPVLRIKDPPGGASVTDGAVLALLGVLRSAPPALGVRVADVKRDYWHGIVLDLRQGPALYFGPATDVRAKWRAVVAVLDTPQSAGAAYIDVTDPWRPAAGAAASSAPATGGAAATSSSSGTG